MKRGRAIVAVGCAAAALSGHPRSAAAADGEAPGGLDLTFAGCAETLRPEVERIARIELHAGGRSAGPPVRIALACTGGDVHVTADDPARARSVERTVSLAGVEPRAHARLLALAVAELARSISIDPEPPAAPSPAPPEPGAEPAPVAVAAIPPLAPWHGDAQVEGVFMPTARAPVLGLALGALRDLASWAFVGATLSGWGGIAQRSPGSIAVGLLAIDPAIGLRAGPVEVGLGVRVGWVDLVATSVEPGFRARSVSGLVVGPEASASLRLGGPLRVWLRAGWLLRGETGDVSSDNEVAIGRFYASLGIGLRVDP